MEDILHHCFEDKSILMIKSTYQDDDIADEITTKDNLIFGSPLRSTAVLGIWEGINYDDNHDGYLLVTCGIYLERYLCPQNNHTK